MKIRGVFDASEDKAVALARETGARCYESAAALLADDGVDVVSVCVPTFAHRQYVEAALAAGKHVLCEKPIALNMKDASAMIEAADKSNALLMVGLTHRFYPENNLVQEAATSGRLGNVLSCSAYRMGVMPDWSADSWMVDPEKSGGAATDFIMHDIDLCNWIGGEPALVTAQGIRSAKGAWDYMHISIEYESGFKGFVEGGWLFKGPWPFTQEHRIMGEKGTAQWRARMGKNIEGRMEADSVVGVYVDGEEAVFPVWEKQDPFALEVRCFLDCARDGRAPAVLKPVDAVRALEVSLAAKQSAESMKPVKICR